MLARDTKRIEDVDTTGPDHGADAIRYGCLRQELAAEVRLERVVVSRQARQGPIAPSPVVHIVGRGAQRRSARDRGKEGCRSRIDTTRHAA